MLYTEETVRANIRNREGKRVFFLRKEDTLTPGARDYLRRERIEVLDASQAKPEVYRLLNGGELREKPEHMTHLYDNVLVCKTHPRIAFRGAMDTLEAEILLCQLTASPEICGKLEEILKFCRNLIRCDVLDEPVPDGTLCGLTQPQIRQRSHFPQDFYAQPHFMPSKADGEKILRLNRCRCMARNAERMAAHAFADREGTPTRPDILRGLNRVSSMLYLLMIEEKSKGGIP